jgi:XPG I-region
VATSTHVQIAAAASAASAASMSTSTASASTSMSTSTVSPSMNASTASANISADVGVYAVTDDLDALAFGAERVILDIDCVRKTATIITLADILKGMSITHAQFVDLCILLGCDYTTATVKGLGLVKSYTMLKAYGNIENILLGEGIDVDPGFTWGSARAVFAAQPVVPVELITARDGGIPAGAQLREWLTAHCGDLNKRMLAVLARLRA